jgi:hypothetical protein
MPHARSFCLLLVSGSARVTGKQELIPGQKSASGKLKIVLALGAECGRVTVDSCSTLRGARLGQARPTHAPAESS